MITLTYPMIGNYGVPDRSLRDEYGLAKGFESDKIHASALLVQVGGRDRGYGGVYSFVASLSHWPLLTAHPFLRQEHGFYFY